MNTIELYWIVWGRGKKQKIESLGILELGWDGGEGLCTVHYTIHMLPKPPLFVSSFSFSSLSFVIGS